MYLFVKELNAFRLSVELIYRLLDLLVVKCGVRAKELGANPKGGNP